MTSTNFPQVTTTDLAAQAQAVEAMLAATTVATETTGQFIVWLGQAKEELARRSN